jgi:FAD/FMN-containing dehydrogenase
MPDPVLERNSEALAWGRVHRGAQRLFAPAWPEEAGRLVRDPGLGPRLVRGLGRSYGDSCLNIGGALIETPLLDRLQAFDREEGLLTADGGFSLLGLLRLCVRPNEDGSYWFPPVLPGTKFVTLGGAIANDVHGKNHHRFGTFGRHVEWLELMRSDGTVLRCSRTENPALFAATIGGLGLTGYIVRACVRLRRAPSPLFDVEDIEMSNLEDFFRLAADSAGYEYTVAWVDCLAEGAALGRGIFSRANHAMAPGTPVAPPGLPALSLPFAFPDFALNSLTLKAFNAAYRRRLMAPRRRARAVHFDKFLFPLDGIGQWNRLYGQRGFYQYQCVVPAGGMREAVREMLSLIAASRQGSFLVVLKTFGETLSPGLLSFPMEGATLALDFPNCGARTLDLLDRLDEVVDAAGGRVYPAKDGRLSAESFQRQYPAWRDFAQHIDPNFSSSFWRRVTEVPGPMKDPA